MTEVSITKRRKTVFSLRVDLNPIFTQHWSNKTHFTWILYSPWKLHNDLFNDKPYNNSGSVTFPLLSQ
jgi:hypothetical protein